MTPGSGRRVLIVEDETMIALIIEHVVAELGCEVVGPASELTAAARLAREETIDVAILDVTIRGGQVFPVADILRERRIPFILASGYGERTLPDRYKDAPWLQKPYTVGQAAKAIGELLSPRP
jgi:CheY-like chemotaxis protein